MRRLSPFFVLCVLLAASAASATLRPDDRAHNPPGKNYDLLHVDADLRIDVSEGNVDGEVDYRLRLLRDGVTRVYLHAGDMSVGPVRVDGVIVEPELRRDEEELWIPLPEAGDYGDTLTVRIRYQAWPGQGLYFRGAGRGHGYPEVWAQGQGENNRYWLPGWDHPTDQATYDLRFTFPADYRVMSNGELVERREDGELATWHWRMGHSMAHYLVTVAAAPYELWTEEVDGVTLEYYVPPGTGEATTLEAFAITAPAVRFLNDFTGMRYPWTRYGQATVQDFLYGGMENTTATVLNQRVFIPEESREAWSEDTLLVHELAHMWFGDWLTCYGWQDFWLNEGFATFSTGMFVEHHEGREAGVFAFDRYQQSAKRDDARRVRAMATRFYNRVDERQSASPYVKGASTLYMLRDLLGERAFAESMKNYLAMGPALVSTEDFQRVVEASSGESLDWFFQQWVLLGGHPELRVTQEFDEESSTLRIAVEQIQEDGDITGLFRLPIVVEAGRDEKSVRHRFWLEEERATFSMALPWRPNRVQVDPEGRLLKELEFERPVGMLVDQLENAGDPWGTVEAIRELGAVSPPRSEAVDALVSLLGAQASWRLRGEAAAALGEQGTPRAVEVLIGHLQDGAEHLRVRRACAEALARHPEAGDALARVFEREGEAHLRAAALNSLVELVHGKAERLCLQALKIDSHRNVIRNAALDGLRELRATDRIDAVERVTRPGAAPRRERQKAVSTLARLVNERNEPDTADRMAERLTQLLDDPSEQIRRTVCQALGSLKSTRALDALERVGAEDRARIVREAAEQAIERIREEE